jgi:hypothetical protein
MLVLFWRGKGFWVPIIVFGWSLIFNFAADIMMNDNSYYDKTKTPFAISLIISAIFIFLLDKKLGIPKSKIYIDKDTGREIEVKKTNEFLFLPIKLWSYICAVIGVIFIIAELFHR